MLTQKMSKEFFLIAYGHNVDANKQNISKTTALFDKTLNGLINGNSEMGLSEAPNPAIKTQLEKVKTMWDSFHSAIKSNPDDSSKQAVEAKNLPLLKEMNAAVQMFAKL